MVCAPKKERPAVCMRGAKAEKTCIILQRLDLFHGFAQGGVTEVALGDLEEAGAGPAGLEECEVFEGGDAVVEAAGEQDG